MKFCLYIYIQTNFIYIYIYLCHLKQWKYRYFYYRVVLRCKQESIEIETFIVVDKRDDWDDSPISTELHKEEGL